MSNNKKSKFFGDANPALTGVGIITPKVNNSVVIDQTDKETRVEESKTLITHDSNLNEQVNKIKFKLTVDIEEDLNQDLEGYAHSSFKNKKDVVIEALIHFLKDKEFKRLPFGAKLSNAGRKKK
jgi:2-phospho-L-lactate guanylyltransferase (CobY/MobA/RfbA family)